MQSVRLVRALRPLARASAPLLRPSAPARVAVALSTPQRWRSYATSSTGPSSSFDPIDMEAQKALDEGFDLLNKGDLEGAKEAYEKSIEVRPTATGLYNLGVVSYQLSDLPGAIEAFTKALSHASPDAPAVQGVTSLSDIHANLGTAYLLTQPPRPDLAVDHLKTALDLNAADGEAAFNLGLVLEVLSGKDGEDVEGLEEAVRMYQRAKDAGVERADTNLRNASAKLLGSKLKREKEGAAPAADAPKSD